MTEFFPTVMAVLKSLQGTGGAAGGLGPGTLLRLCVTPVFWAGAARFSRCYKYGSHVSYGFTLLRRSAEPAHSTEALKGSSRQGSGPQLGHAP